MSLNVDHYGHGVLGYWAIVGHGFNIASIIASSLVIAVVILTGIRKPSALGRPTFQLSGWIGACDTIYSTTQLFVFNNAYMASRPEIQLRVIHWLLTSANLSVAFLSSSICLHMLLTVLTHKEHIANKIKPWYGCVSGFLGFFIPHPFLYLFRAVLWGSQAQMFHVYDTASYYKLVFWLTVWAWLFANLVFMLVVVVFLCIKMSQSYKSFDTFSSIPECDEKWDSTSSSLSARKARKQMIRLTVFRMALYPLIPIFSQGWIVIVNMVNGEVPMWLFVVASIVPSFQGVFNFFVFALNPYWDDYTKQLIGKVFPSRRPTRPTHTDFMATPIRFRKADIETSSGYSTLSCPASDSFD